MSYPKFASNLGITIESDEFENDLEEFLDKYMGDTDDETFEKLLYIPQHHDNFLVNDEWLEARKHVITGSRMAGYVGLGYGAKNRQKNQMSYMKKYVWPEKHGYVNRKYTDHGTYYEECAELALYEILHQQMEKGLIKGFQITNPGLVMGMKRCFGYSPDGVVEIELPNGEFEYHLTEYKCPYSKKDMEHGDRTPMYKKLSYPLKQGSGESGEANIPVYYYCQIQYGMGLLRERGILKAEKLVCHFVCWTFGPVHYFTIPFDEGFYRWMISEALDVYKNVYAPSIIKKKHHMLQYATLAST